MNTEITLGIPHVHYFYPSDAPTSYTLVGPDHQIAKASNLGTPVADATNGGYVVTITPNELGTYTFLANETGGAVVHNAQFESVRATAKEREFGVSLPHHDLVEIWSPLAFDSVGTLLRLGGAEAIRSYRSTGKQVIPMDGWIYGLSLFDYTGSGSDYDLLSSIRFATINPVDGKVRGVSEDFIAKARAMTPDTWNEILFDKPVWGKAGDGLCFEIGDSGLSNAYSIGLGVPATGLTVQIVEAKNSALDLSGTNTFDVNLGPNYLFMAKPLMAPPHIAIGGHSVFSGYPNATSIFDNGRVYNRTYDLAAMLSDALGLRVLNIAVSSQNITSYVMDGAFFDQFVAQLRPSVLLFDTVASDYGASGGPMTSTLYVLMLDRLMARCVQLGIELIMVEGPPMGSVMSTDPPTIDGMRERRAIIQSWAQQQGIPVIPMEFLVGMHSGGSEHLSQRNYQKTLTHPTVRYDVEGDSIVHLSLEGLKAVGQGLVNAFRPRRHIESRLSRQGTTFAEVESPESPLANSLIVNAALGTASGGMVANTNTIKAKTDQFVFTKPGKVDANALNSTANILTVTDINNPVINITFLNPLGDRYHSYGDRYSDR